MKLQYSISATMTICSLAKSTNLNAELWITKIVNDDSLSHLNAAGFFSSSPHMLINSPKVVKVFYLWNIADRGEIKL